MCVSAVSLYLHFYLSIEQTSHNFQIQRLHMLKSLTVSHLARARSSSNLANSRLSWMVTSNFHISRAAKPRNKIAPATDRSTTKMSGPLGQSRRKEEDRNEWAKCTQRRRFQHAVSFLHMDRSFLTQRTLLCCLCDAWGHLNSGEQKTSRYQTAERGRWADVEN